MNCLRTVKHQKGSANHGIVNSRLVPNFTLNNITGALRKCSIAHLQQYDCQFTNMLVVFFL